MNVVSAVAIAAVLILFVFEPVRVQGFSMMPRLSNNERLFVDKLGINIRPIERGDVVVFHYPRDPSQSFIKRVIGLPGDEVAISGGMVSIDGKALPEPYVPQQFRDYGDFAAIKVPPHEYFVLASGSPDGAESDLFGGLTL